MGLIVLSNRAPYAPVKRDGEQVNWQPAVGGLTTAVEPILIDRGGTWIAWGEGMPHLTSVTLPRHNPSFSLQRVKLTDNEVKHFYHGLSNSALWPVSHYFVGRARFSHDDWRAYERVNRRFADAAIETYQEGDVIWVHDYQLALVPGMIREALPNATIGFFWHIPWPAPEVFSVVPWAKEVLRGVLGSDLIGVHTPEYARNFAACCRDVLGADVDGTSITHAGRTVNVEAHPIGVDTAELDGLSKSPTVGAAAKKLGSELGTRVLLGVDRLDYTKGIPERLEAYDLLLRDHPELHGQLTFVQIAVPSREMVESYREVREAVEGLVGRINGRYGRGNWVPVRYLSRKITRERLAAYFRVADVMLVTPLRDGLNLVAKEFVSVSHSGELLLSRFAGAAAEMHGATLVNPFDREGMAAAMLEALQRPEEERARRIQEQRDLMRDRDVHAWARDFLSCLERGPAARQAVGAGR